MKRPPDPAFAERLKKLMEKAGYSVEEREVSKFADEIKRKPSTVFRWLNGHPPTIYEDIEMLADKFEVTFEYFMRGTEKRVIKRLELIYNKNKDKPLRYKEEIEKKDLLGVEGKEFILRVKVESIEIPHKIPASKKI